MRIILVGYIILTAFTLILIDGFLIGRGWSGQSRIRVALTVSFVFAILLIFAGWNGWLTTSEGLR